MFRRLFAAAVLLMPAALPAQTARPQLVVAIAVDQFSADLFAEYRSTFSGGLKRMAGGVVFPAGYQSHAATETCPGHSTILTGVHPARSGIPANSWIDQTLTRADKSVNCAEDPALGKSSSGRDYVPAFGHLRVPTLGERLKSASPASLVVSLAGKDRAAMMLGGRGADQVWFLRPSDYAVFETVRDRTAPPPAAIAAANARIAGALAQAQPDLPLPTQCAARSRPVRVGERSVGTGRFARDAGDKARFRASPAADAAILDLAEALVGELRLGQRGVPDLLALGLSATDIVGHAYGTGGAEMCVQLAALDARLGRLFETLDRRGIDYVVTLTADHGGHDAPERNRDLALPDAQRVDAALAPKRASAAVRQALRLKVEPLVGAEAAAGSIQIARDVPRGKRPAVLKRAAAYYRALPQVAGVFTAAEIAATPMPTGLPETWTLIERIKTSFVPGRSGDLEVALKPRVTPIADVTASYIATHGSPYDYDRRVPILFWRRGLTPFEQPNSVETIDIAPTLAALLGLAVPAGDFDGRCLDLDAGTGSTCR